MIDALYVHVPFCRRKCGYCDFYSVVAGQSEMGPLTAATRAELRRYAARDDLRPTTIFVGGGTPTVLPSAELTVLLGDCRALAPALREFTVEANPATVSADVARALVAAGVNRVSIGAQSFAPAELAALDRDHAPAQVAETVAACRAAGLTRISLDLIFGIPGQTAASWRKSLAAAVALEPEHLSSYGLTYEPGTPLTARRAAGLVTPIDEDLEAELYEVTLEELAAAGFEQYEISNWARGGAVCEHNLTYWRNQAYVGVGPAAAGYVDGVRYQNVADLHAYRRALEAEEWPRASEERLDTRAAAGETAMLALRTRAGLERGRFAARFGADPVAYFDDAVERHVAAGLLEVTPESVRLTRAGLLLANRVMADFLG